MATRLMGKVLKIPKWSYHRIRWGLLWRARQILMRWRSYDYPALFRIISELTGVSPEAAKCYYEEIHDERVLDEIGERIRGIPDLFESERRDMFYLGMEKYLRLDRTVLYCIVRALRPEVFVETGTRWGMGSYFIARAME